MSDIVVLIAAIAVYMVLNKWVLPKMGIGT